MERPELRARLLVALFSLGVLAVPVAMRLADKTLEIHGTMAESGGWTPSAIEARVGQPLHLHLRSDDVMHGFAVGRMDMPAVDMEPGKMTAVTHG